MGGLCRFLRTIYYLHKERKLAPELEGKTVADPVLGQLTYHDRRWEGRCTVAALGEVPLRVNTWLGRPPSEVQRQAFRAFAEDAEHLVKLAEEATLKWYNEALRDDYPDLPEFTDALEFRSILRDARVFVGLDEHDGAVTLEWGHPYPGQPRKRGFRYSVSFEDGRTATALPWPESMWDAD